jgi:hypothetical protein
MAEIISSNESAELQPPRIILGVEISIFAPAHPPRFFPTFRNKSSTRMFYKELYNLGIGRRVLLKIKNQFTTYTMPRLVL